MNSKKDLAKKVITMGGAAAGAAVMSLFMAGSAFAATTTTSSSTTTPSHHSTKGSYKHVRTILANAAFGKVASIDGSTITLTHKTKTGTATTTVVTTGTTTYKMNGVAGTVSDVTVGEHVVVMGTKDTSGNITDAKSVNVMKRKAK